jgi:hypothetical protein
VYHCFHHHDGVYVVHGCRDCHYKLMANYRPLVPARQREAEARARRRKAELVSKACKNPELERVTLEDLIEEFDRTYEGMEETPVQELPVEDMLKWVNKIKYRLTRLQAAQKLRRLEDGASVGDG